VKFVDEKQAAQKRNVIYNASFVDPPGFLLR